jgi:peptide deformylase
VILEKSGQQEPMEGCLSIPGKWGITRRPKHVRVRAQDRNGKFFEYEGEDLLATASCHEIDHLDGILFLTHVIRMLTRKELEQMNSSED